MATKRNPITDPTGEKAKRRAEIKADRGARANLKKRFEEPSTTSPTTEPTNTTSQGENQSSNTASTIIGEIKKGLTHTFQGGSPLLTTPAIEAYKQGLDIASQYGIQESDLKSLLGSDPYRADGSSPMMTVKEANAEKLKIAKQQNAEEVKGDKLKLNRVIVKNDTEQVRLIGDLVDFHTAKIEVGTKVIHNQVAEVKFKTEQSKLEETIVLYEQQTIQTSGTVSLTPGIREIQDLRLQELRAKVGAMQITVEITRRETKRKFEEMDAKLLDY